MLDIVFTRNIKALGNQPFAHQGFMHNLLHYGKTIRPKDVKDNGKEVAMTYRLEAGEEFASGVETPHKPQSVNGRVANVNVYGTNPVAPGKRSEVL